MEYAAVRLTQNERVKVRRGPTIPFGSVETYALFMLTFNFDGYIRKIVHQKLPGGTNRIVLAKSTNPFRHVYYRVPVRYDRCVLRGIDPRLPVEVVRPARPQIHAPHAQS